jgi:hypothetical protein
LEIISKMDKSQFVSPRTRQFAMPHRAERQTQVYSSPESEGTDSLSISKTSRAVTAKLRNLSALLPHVVFGCGRVNEGTESADNTMKAGAIKAATEAKCPTMRRRRASSLD